MLYLFIEKHICDVTITTDIVYLEKCMFAFTCT